MGLRNSPAVVSPSGISLGGRDRRLASLTAAPTEGSGPGPDSDSGDSEETLRIDMVQHARPAGRSADLYYCFYVICNGGM